MFRNSLLSGFGVLTLLFLSTTLASSQTYMIRQTVSMQGQKMTNTTYVKGPRKRTVNGGMMGMGADVATIEQCDLKQNLKVNDKKKLYTIEPFDTDNDTPTSRPTGVKAKTQPVKKGGTVTYINNITDTGERKQMFGVTARHLKTSMSMEASPDACSKADMKMETDGWYIDLPEFSCPVNFRPQTMPTYQAPQSGGCQDHIVSRSTGSGKLGFPLQETRTMSMGEGQSFSQTTETVEFSRAPLEQSLFDVPTGYSIASDPQQLYGQPDMAAMMRAAQAGNNDDDGGSQSKTNPSFNSGSNSGNMPANFSGTKIAVLMPTSKADGVSTSSLQMFLIDKLSGGNVRGMAVGSEAEAKAAGATYILTSDISKLKQSKAGGLFGAVTGISAAAKFDAQVDYKLVKLADGSMVLSSKAASKSETEANAAAQNILGMEAVAVLGAIR
ncbi:MAG TPA: hypothetical protein VGO43_15060 [Pyrinomonadaceae bacterium]|nr:hypothetical protein [Pyrinomonadaceae bacterium]